MTEASNPLGPADGQLPPEAVPEPEISVGAQLRAAREQLGWSVIDVAQRLKFAPRQIEALESDNHVALPGLTFVRGFVRSYAKLLGMEADGLVGALERAAALEAGPSTVQLQSLTATPQRFPMRNSSSGSAWPWVVAMVVAVVGLGGFTLYQWQAPEAMSHPTPAANTQVAPPNVTPMQTEAPSATPASGNAASAGTTVTAPAASIAPSAAVPASAMPASVMDKPAAADKGAEKKADVKADAGPGKGKIRMVFSQESWTEVRQAGGQIVFSKQNAPGSEAWVDGQPPFEFVIGNAQGVKLFYRGSEVDLKPYIKITVARMQLK